MKTKSLFVKLFLFIAILGSFLFNSCSKEEAPLVPEPTPSSTLSFKNSTLPYMVCDLIAAQHINVGRVIYSQHIINGENNLVIEYITSFGWSLKEVHLYVGSLALLPSNKSALQIGHFPFYETNLNGVTTYSFTLPFSSLTKNEDGSYAIFAHAIVINGLQEETAWANCDYKPIITLKSLFTPVNNVETYAVSEGTHFSQDWYCIDMGYNVFKNPDEYLLQSWMYPASLGGAGKVNVSANSTTLKVVVTPKEGLNLSETFLFVGSMSEFDEIFKTIGTCPEYTKFPYILAAKTPTHTFEIAIPKNYKSIPFESIDPKMRWGWYSIYVP